MYGAWGAAVGAAVGTSAAGEPCGPPLFSESSILCVVNPRRACAARVTVLVLCVCVCVHLSHRANLRTGASRRLTEGTSGLSGTFFTKVKRCFL